MQDGFGALFGALLDRYPGSAEFQALAAVYAPQQATVQVGTATVDRTVDAGRGYSRSHRQPPVADHRRPDRRGGPSGSSEDQSEGSPRRIRVLLVGCSEYPSDPVGLASLPAVRGNLDELRALFLDPATGGLTPGQLVVVNDPADPAAVLTALIEAAQQELDLLVVYYAGHGILANGALRLGLTSTTAATAAWTGLEAALVRLEVSRALACTKVLIVDSCFSGRLAAMADPGSLVDTQLSVSGAVTLASSPGDTVSFSPVGESLTAFTGELVRVLRGGFQGRGRMLTMDDVYDAVRAGLRRRGFPEPRMLHSDRAAQVSIVRNRAWAE